MNTHLWMICTSLLCSLVELSSAHIYGLLLNNPLPASSFESISAEETNGSSPDTLNKNASADTVLIKCKQDSDCIDDNSSDSENLMYCDQHYGHCDFFRKVSELCRHDSQCDSGLICMFGKCARPFKPGHRGARCHGATDCNEGLCCARQHGERICKPKLKSGQQCFVPLGGLDYSLNELCPCDEGLECQQVKAKNKRKRHFKSDTVMRCTQSKAHN